MKIVTSEQMRALDEAAVEKHGMTSLELMEHAGQGLASIASDVLPEGGRILVLAGRGNNGGDGLVAARFLSKRDIEVDVIVLSSRDWLSEDAHVNMKRLEGKPIKLHSVSDESEFENAIAMMTEPALIVDAIFGTGLTREVTDLPKRAIEYINGRNAKVVSADVPSGLSSDTGEVMGVAVKADHTATFSLKKRGLILGEGPSLAGKIDVIDIGIPAEEIELISSCIEMIEPENFISRFKPRDLNTHKGSYGHVVVFAGSLGHLGAGYLVSMGALRSGCGLVTYCMPETSFEKIDARYPEIMLDAIPDDETSFFNPVGIRLAIEKVKGKDVLAIGPAIGTTDGVKGFVNTLLAETSVAAVVDADAPNVLNLQTLSERDAPTILTPHPLEMARLIGLEVEEVQADRFAAARQLAERARCIVVLKGNMTVVASPDSSVSINPTGNPGMATAGMGDALTGVIAGFLAEGMDPLIAAKAGVYLHGLAGDIAASEVGQESLVVTDVIAHVGRAIQETRNGK